MIRALTNLAQANFFVKSWLKLVEGVGTLVGEKENRPTPNRDQAASLKEKERDVSFAPDY